MITHTIFFYFFSIISIASALMVIATRNTVHAVFFLILDFISVGCLFIMIGAEFLGMIMLIVYVGAVAVLFLFVVMMLNVAEQKQSWFRDKEIKSTHIPIGLIVSIIILAEVLVVVGGWKYKTNFIKTELLQLDENFTNTHMLGNVLYTEYIHLFQVAGIILLLAMIGAIVLTYAKRQGVKTQSYITQISRERITSIELGHADFNKGVKIDD